MSKPPSSGGPRRHARSAPLGTSAKQAPAKKGPKPRGPKPDAPREEKRPAPRAKGPRANRPQREERTGPRAARPARGKSLSPRAERPVREERSSPSRTNRARLFREERGGTPGERPARPGPERAQRPEPAPLEEPFAPHSDGAPQRIAKLLARAGVASRREIERMIAEGRIANEGATVETPATILTSLRGVTVDGKPVRAPTATRLFLFHKPAGLLTAANDPKGRPTIYDRLPQGLPRVVPVGRLDLNTEGLLLLTNDGEFKRQLELPSTGIVRSYRARVFGEISQEQLEELIQGIEIEGMRYGSIDANLERRTGRNAWVEMRLTEGKNREVRRVLEYLGLQVSRLIRTSYGPFALDGMPPGYVEEVRQNELVEFRKTLK